MTEERIRGRLPSRTPVPYSLFGLSYCRCKACHGLMSLCIIFGEIPEQIAYAFESHLPAGAFFTTFTLSVN